VTDEPYPIRSPGLEQREDVGWRKREGPADRQVILPSDHNKVHQLADSGTETLCGQVVTPEDLTTVVDVHAHLDGKIIFDGQTMKQWVENEGTTWSYDKNEELDLCIECYPPEVRRQAGGGKAIWWAESHARNHFNQYLREGG